MAIAFAVTVDGINIAGPISACQNKAAVSISVWAWFNAISAGQRTLVDYSLNGSANARVVLQWGAGTPGKMLLQVRAPDAQPQGNVAAATTFGAGDLNKWIHLAAVADIAGGTGKIFINGVQDVSAAWSAAQVSPLSNTSSDSGRINTRPTSVPGTEGIDGRLEAMRLWDVALTANQIKTLFTGRERTNIRLANQQHWYAMVDRAPGVAVATTRARGPLERINGTNQGTPAFIAGKTWPRRRAA